jgi:hypothetical protein
MCGPLLLRSEKICNNLQVYAAAARRRLRALTSKKCFLDLSNADAAAGVADYDASVGHSTAAAASIVPRARSAQLLARAWLPNNALAT